VHHDLVPPDIAPPNIVPPCNLNLTVEFSCLKVSSLLGFSLVNASKQVTRRALEPPFFTQSARGSHYVGYNLTLAATMNSFLYRPAQPSS
jgi:hypothetical protein